MKITSPSLILLLFLNSFLGQSQITSFREKFELPEVVKETSGLLLLMEKSLRIMIVEMMQTYMN